MNRSLAMFGVALTLLTFSSQNTVAAERERCDNSRLMCWADVHPEPGLETIRIVTDRKVKPQGDGPDEVELIVRAVVIAANGKTLRDRVQVRFEAERCDGGIHSMTIRRGGNGRSVIHVHATETCAEEHDRSFEVGF